MVHFELNHEMRLVPPSPPSPASSPVSHAHEEKRPISVYDEETIEETYDRLVSRLSQTATEITTFTPSRQYWVAIAGGPGSGKSTVAEEIAKRLNEQHGDDTAVVLPMDGYHFTKQELREMNPPHGEDYMRRRGAPWTINAEACHKQLRQAKGERCGTFPTLCRKIADPVPSGVELSQKHKIVIVEGLYLLLQDDPRWEQLSELWDEGWFIRCASREEQRERLVSRSLQNWTNDRVETFGPGKQGAENKVDQNDAKNMDIVASCEKFADVLIISKNSSTPTI